MTSRRQYSTNPSQISAAMHGDDRERSEGGVLANTELSRTA